MTDTQLFTEQDLQDLTQWRRELHQYPELSGEETATADRVVTLLKDCGLDSVLTRLGGHGVAAIFEGKTAGPTVLLRCELDGLPIEELNPTLPHRSKTPGKGHLCGHDGHMAILAATARWLSRNRPDQGRVILLFQPAEEDGSGAAKVIADPRFATIAPDYAFALHNFPGIPMGAAVLAPGPLNCASRGLKITLTGRTAHASQPENGISPAPAVAQLLTALPGLGRSSETSDSDFALVTVTHARLGEPAFGIAPGQAEVWATLRTQKDAAMADLVRRAETAIADVAQSAGLDHQLSYHDVFQHCENDPDATRILDRALDTAGLARAEAEMPMRGSEDFGRFGAEAKSAMFLLGSGMETASLHNPDFDFPDQLIPQGAAVFIAAVQELCGAEGR